MLILEGGALIAFAIIILVIAVLVASGGRKAAKVTAPAKPVQPEQVDPEQSAPEPIDQEQIAPEQADQEQTASEQIEPEQTVPAQVEPEQTAPGQVETVPSTRETRPSAPEIGIEPQASGLSMDTEKRAAISTFQIKQLANRRQAAEQSEVIEQLDFPENTAPDYVYNISRGTTVSDFSASNGTSISDRWSMQPSPYAERDVAVMKRQLYELAGQLHLMQHKSRAIEQRVLEISSALERMDHEDASTSTGSASHLPYNGQS